MTDTTERDETDEFAERIADSVRDQLATDEGSRRSFLSRSAIAGGALLALGGGTGLAVANEHEDEGDGQEMGSSFEQEEGTDLDMLNYALSLEHLESAFYTQAMEAFSEDDFMQAEALQGYSEEMRQMLYSYVQTAGEQEAVHVEVLTQAVQLLGGDPAPAASYEFPMADIGEFLSLAQTLENTGVAAYAGAAPYIESPDLLRAALAIHSVEARHAALFNKLNGVSPFPSAFDEPMSPEEVLDAIAPFIAEPAEGGEGTDTGTGTDNGTDTGTGTDNGTATGTGTDNGTATGTGTDNGTATGTGTGTGTGNTTATDAGS